MNTTSRPVLVGMSIWLSLVLPFSARAQSKVTVAVGTFENKSPVADSEVASFTDMITTALVKTRKFEVLERDRIAELLKEQVQGEIGLMDSATAQKLGELTGADFILVGTLTQAAVEQKGFAAGGLAVGRAVARLSVDIRILDAKTGRITVAETVRKEKQGSVKLASEKIAMCGADSGTFGEVARECADEVVALTAQAICPIRVIGVTPDGIMLNYGSGTLKVDDAYDVFALGEELNDPDTGEVLGRAETRIGRITITSVEAKFSKARIDEGGEKIEKDMICRRVPAVEQATKNEKKREEKKKKFFP